MTSQFLTFALGEHAYAIPLARVREVVGCRTVVRVPNSGASIRGLMNLRGNVVPVIDFARRLGTGEVTLSDTTCAVLMEAAFDGGDAPVAALVEQIRAVVDIDAADVAAPPGFGLPVDPRLVRGITPTADQLVYVLDLDEILAGLA